ncbi:MAG TPA: AMP-binding protein [Thermoanaerobaculia bacterium]|nr:AMP-binding protein [Thermoanaerobaculia bacterium]
MSKAFLPGASATPDAVGLVDDARSWTCRELDHLTARFANGIGTLGMRVGDRIAILARNSAEWLVVYFGSMRAGAVFVPLNHHLQHDELVYILRDSATRLLCCDAENEVRAQTAASEAGVERVLAIDDMFDGWLDRQLDVWPAGHLGGVPMAYTSGTTGRPKGLEPAPQTRTAEQVVEDMERLAILYGYRRGGAHLVASTMDHGAPALHALMAATMGQTLVIQRRFDAAEALGLIERHRVTTTHMVPTQIIRLVRLPQDARDRADLSSLEAVFHGAAPCPPWAKTAAIEWLGPILIEYFGAKEGCGPFLCTSSEWLARPGTVGRAGPHIAVTVVGDDGRDLPAGEIGTLYFRRADGRAPTYRGDPVKTAASRLPDGRFTVGDVGWLDDDGYLHLADRRADLILTGGVNVYPAEVEAALGQHPAVEDCAVYGVPDEEWGEAVKAAVVPRAGADIAEADLIAWLRERLAHFKCPRSIELVAELPREEIGKLKRRVLRDAARAGRSIAR